MIHFAPVAHLHVAYVNCATIETLLIDICHISRAYILSKFPCPAAADTIYSIHEILFGLAKSQF